MADAAFLQIRQYACSNPAVAIRLLEIISEIAPHAHHSKDRDALALHARLIKEDSDAAILNQRDLQDVENRYHRALSVLDKAPEHNSL